MPKVEDQFSGHFYPGDPRNNLTGAFGCNWPSVPAYRYIMDAPNARQVWELFKVFPPLVELVTDVADHDISRWSLINHPEIYRFVRWDKLPIDSEWDGFEWVLTWSVVGAEDTISDSFIVPTPRAGNQDVALPNWRSDLIAGELGEDAYMRQVVWNETEAPT